MNAAQRPVAVFARGGPRPPRFALTFDDGPDARWTPAVLDALRAETAKATFFVLGREVAKRPAVLGRIAAEGHTVASHGYDHVNLAGLPAARVRQQLDQAAEAVQKVIGRRPLLFRPPYGSYNAAVVEAAQRHGGALILWSVDPEDWRGKPAAAIEKSVMAAAGAGGIILLHSGEGPNLGGTVAALPGIIRALRTKGLEPATVDELLGLPAYR